MPWQNIRCIRHFFRKTGLSNCSALFWNFKGTGGKIGTVRGDVDANIGIDTVQILAGGDSGDLFKHARKGSGVHANLIC